MQHSTLFESQRGLLLEVRNQGDGDLRIGAIQLASPLFEALPPEDRDARVRAGGRVVAMPLLFGEARCDGVATGDGADRPPELVTDVGGEEVRVALEESPPGLLADLHAEDCAVAEVLADVEVRLGDDWERTAPGTVAGEVVLTQRRPGVTAALDEVRGNVIFALTGPAESRPWLEVSDARPTAAVGVTISADRCDPHALIEYKSTFTVPAEVAVGGADPVRIDIDAEGAARTALEQILASCLD